jgi:hypothetical protein
LAFGAECDVNHCLVTNHQLEFFGESAGAIMKIPSSLKKGRFFSKLFATVSRQFQSGQSAAPPTGKTQNSKAQPSQVQSTQGARSPIPPARVSQLQIQGLPDQSRAQVGSRPQIGSLPQVGSKPQVGSRPQIGSRHQIGGSPQHPLNRKFRPQSGLPLLPLFLTPSVLAVGAWASMVTVPRAPDCRQPSWLMNDGSRLYCANQTARTGNVPALTSALTMVSGWSKDHPLYNQANRLAEEWSVSVLIAARQQAEQGNFQRAKELAQLIPKSVSTHQEAQQLFSFWDTSGDEGKTLLKAAESALKQLDWARARANARMMMGLRNQQWQAQAQKIIQITAVEETAWNQLLRAEDFASYKSPTDLVEAIQIAQKLTAGTAAYQEAQAKLKDWNKQLLEFALARQQAGDVTGAVELLSKVTPDTAKAAGVQDLMQLGKAEEVAKPDNFWGYLHALALSQQIPPQTNISNLAESQRQRWQQQVQNRAQLQLANWLASGQNMVGYRLAISQANLIGTDQPQHQQSRELVNRWQQQVSRLEDQPYLNAAVALSQRKQYRQAIAAAQVIRPQRPLYEQAQQQIWAWQGELQGVVDRPILDRAEELARIGSYNQAIALANQISPDRVIYREAQRKIDGWRQTLYEIEAAPRSTALRPCTDTLMTAP